MKEFILHIGIGQGGRVLDTEDGVQHVGMDIVPGKLLDVQEKYWRSDPHLVLADGFEYLPFRSDTFKKVNVHFPYVLFYGLINSKYALWPEMRRVLKMGGDLDIVFDVHKDRKGGVIKKVEVPELGLDDYLTHPVERVKAVGGMFGFDLQDVPATPLEIQRELGTYFSQRIFRDSEQDPGFMVTRLQAQKQVRQAVVQAQQPLSMAS